MGLTITKIPIPTQPQRVGQQLCVECDILFDSSYPTGGESLTPAMAGLTKITAVETQPSVDGRVFEYDLTGQKLLAFQSAGSAAALAQVPDTTSLVATTTHAKIYGL